MEVIDNTIRFVKQQLENAEGGHDWFHIERVYKNTLLIAHEEKCDLEVVKLAALLHDIADSKFHEGDETIGPQLARTFLESQQVPSKTIEHVIAIIENISFKGGNFDQHFHSKELAIVQDADRLDAIGAIGIARTFNYGGLKIEHFIIRKLRQTFLCLKKNIKKVTHQPSITFTKNYYF
jgi:uncharacterized protein